MDRRQHKHRPALGWVEVVHGLLHIDALLLPAHQLQQRLALDVTGLERSLDFLVPRDCCFGDVRFLSIQRTAQCMRVVR